MSIMEIRDLEIPELEVYIDKKEVQLCITMSRSPVFLLQKARM